MGKNLKFIFGLVVFILIFSTISGYAYLKSREFFQGPAISITSPVNGSTLSEAPVTIEGNAQNISHITLNGAAIFIDSQGNFSEKLLLLPGYNIMTLSAEDRFGKQTKKTLELVYKPPIIGTSVASSTLPTL